MSYGELTHTHDGQYVYPADAPLPFGAEGWTQCDNAYASYLTWLEPEDRERSRATSKRLVAEVKRFTKAELKALGYYGKTACDLRLSLYLDLYKALWPMRASKLAKRAA